MIACVYIPQFALSVAHGGPITSNEALILVDERKVLDCSPAATGAGIEAGMRRKEALRLVPDFVVHDQGRVHEYNQRLEKALRAFSPKLERVEEGMFLVDLGKITERVNLSKEIEEMLRRVTKDTALYPAIGVAASRFVATVAARYTKTGSFERVSNEAGYLADKSIACLPIDKESCRRLELIGIFTIGQLKSLPRRDLMEQFGALGEKLLNLIYATQESPLDLLPEKEPIASSVCFDFTLEGGRCFLSALKKQVEEVMETLNSRCQLCMALKIIIECEGLPPISFKQSFASPLGCEKRAWRAVEERVRQLTLKAPVSELKVIAEDLVGQFAKQMRFDVSMRPRQVCNHLRLRRPGAVMQVVWDDRASRLPERVAHLQGILDAMSFKGLVEPVPIWVVVSPKGLPDRVKTRSGWVKVDHLIESWQLDDEWWTPRPIIRNYHRVALCNGNILRLFRDGVNGGWYRQGR